MTITRTLKFILPILLLFTSIILGCTFEPEEEFFSAVQPVTPSAIIDLTDHNEEDTIVLLQPTTFKFNVAISEPSTLQEVQVVLDSGTLLVTGASPSGEFSVSQFYLPLGIHKLTIRFLAKSNSGSLADNLGVEHFQVWKSWVLKVERFDNDPPAPPALTITEQNGYLRLDWTPYTKNNFEEYRLRVHSPYQRDVVFNDRHTTTWIDSTFLWGQAGYELIVTNIFGSASAGIGITEPQSLTVTYNKNDSTAVLKWKPSRFYSAFGSAVISENYTIRNTITNASDSTFALKLEEVLWGQSEFVTLQVFPKSNNVAPFEAREHLYNLTPAKLLRGRPELRYNNGIKQVVGYSRSNALVYLYDAQMEVTDSTIVHASALSVPYSGNYAYYVNNNTVVRWDLDTDEKVQSNDNANFVIEPSSIHGSANGLVSYYSMNNQYPWDVRVSHVIQNTDDKSFLQKTNTNYDPKITLPPKSMVLSDDGRFGLAAYNQQIYKLETGLPLAGSLPQIGWFLCFRHDNNDELLLSWYGLVYVISTQDMSTLRTINLPSGYIAVDYDPVTHYVVCTKSESKEVYLINIDTGQSKTVAAVSSQWNLVNGHLINYAGEYLKVL